MTFKDLKPLDIFTCADVELPHRYMRIHPRGSSVNCVNLATGDAFRMNLPTPILLEGTNIQTPAPIASEKSRKARSRKLYMLEKSFLQLTEDKTDGTDFDCAVLRAIRNLQEQWGHGGRVDG